MHAREIQPKVAPFHERALFPETMHDACMYKCKVAQSQLGTGRGSSLPYNTL